MKNIVLILLFLTSTFHLSAQYEFTPVIDLNASNVKSQGKTGTCWSFSSSSFIESEIERISGKKIDISEMYSVRTTYDDKTWNYVMRQGKAQFSEGGLAHDVMNAIQKNGLVPQEAFTGLFGQSINYDHSDLIPELKSILDKFIAKDSTVTDWKTPSKTILDKKIGLPPESFTYQGKTYTPMEFLKMTKLDPRDYITLTSFMHQPYYSEFILDIPDNFSYGSFYNLPMDIYMNVLDSALKNGYTVELDIDYSEPSYSRKTGVSFIPKKAEDIQKGLTEIVDELEVTPEFRQAEFENYNTTDDHLMHITGIAKDQKGNKYYKVKNSWGTDFVYGGYVYISKAYMELKSISIMIHKDAIPEEVKDKLDI
ncbi:MAG: C1 family peptidase [Bacteroidota bacterium]